MSTPVETCCEDPQLRWESRQIVDRFADVLACANCRRTHKVEDWAISIAPPDPERCVNCGGDLMVDTSRSRHAAPTGELRCAACHLTPKESRKLHSKLARLHPSGRFLEAARAATEGGRVVLGFKLATAHLAYEGDDVDARMLRLQGLEALGMVEPALEEAWRWLDEGGPSTVLSTIAGLEASRGNMEATVEALERGLRMDPQNLSMWTDYAEIQAHFDDRDGALASAGYGLNDPRYKQRCLDVIATVAERAYAEEDLEGALDAVNRAGAAKQDSVDIAWITARIAARLRQWDEAEAWLQVTLELDPDHRQAQEALARIKPREKRRGWFGWLGGGGDG